MAKKKKRMSKEELRAPDPIEASIERAWKKVEPHKTKIIAVFVVALVGGVGWTVYSNMQASSQAEKADALAQAMHPLTAALWDPETDAKPDPQGNVPTKPTGETFKDFDAAQKAAEERLAKYLADNPNADGANAVALGVAGLEADTDPAKAAADLEKWLANNGDNKTATMVRMSAGWAHLAAGNREGARGHFGAVASSSDGWFKSLALGALGDLDNPLLAGKDGNAAEAAKKYEEAVALIGDNADARNLGLKESLETKLALLQ